MPSDRVITVPEEIAGERLDRALALLIPEISRSRAGRLVSAGAVRIDGVRASKPSQSVALGQALSVSAPTGPADVSLPEPEAIDLAILYEDDHLAVVDKAAGMVVHPSPGHARGTLVAALLHRYGERLARAGADHRPGIVHRLDKGTTGVLVVALNPLAHERISRQFADRTVQKEYEALVYGHPDGAEGTIDAPLGRDAGDRKKISVRTTHARDAITDWKRAEDFPGFSLLQVRPRTGRTHQIRAHLAHIRHPLVGDEAYAGRQWKGVPQRRIRDTLRGFGRPALHARRLTLEHPATGERVTFEAARPADLEALLTLLRGWRDGKLPA